MDSWSNHLPHLAVFTLFFFFKEARIWAAFIFVLEKDMLARGFNVSCKRLIAGRNSLDSQENYYSWFKNQAGFSMNSSSLELTAVKAPVKWTQRPRNFKCSYCRRGFVVKRDLMGHMNSVHLNVKPYICSRCGMRFPNYKTWKGHEKTCRHC